MASNGFRASSALRTAQTVLDYFLDTHMGAINRYVHEVEELDYPVVREGIFLQPSSQAEDAITVYVLDPARPLSSATVVTIPFAYFDDPDAFMARAKADTEQ